MRDKSSLEACTRLYSKITKTLAAFENMWIAAWSDNLGPVISCLRATLFTLHPTTNVVTVNLDSELVCLIREAKSLVRLGVSVSSGCEQLIQQGFEFVPLGPDHLKDMIAQGLVKMKKVIKDGGIQPD